MLPLQALGTFPWGKHLLRRFSQDTDKEKHLTGWRHYRITSLVVILRDMTRSWGAYIFHLFAPTKRNWHLPKLGKALPRQNNFVVLFHKRINFSEPNSGKKLLKFWTPTIAKYMCNSARVGDWHWQMFITAPILKKRSDRFVRQFVRQLLLWSLSFSAAQLAFLTCVSLETSMLILSSVEYTRTVWHVSQLAYICLTMINVTYVEQKYDLYPIRAKSPHSARD